MDTNPFLQPPLGEKDQRPPERSGGGRYYARFSKAELPDEDGKFGGSLLYEAFDADWFDEARPPEGQPEREEYYARAPLFVLEIPWDSYLIWTLPHRGPATPQHTADYLEENFPWLQITVADSSQEGGFEITLYHNLYAAGIRVRVESLHIITDSVTKRLRQAVSTAHIPDASRRDIHRALRRVGSIDWAVVYDVGQGGANGLCNAAGEVAAYFDFGGGVLANVRTFPVALTQACFVRQPPVMLSHWDFDHWSSANRFPGALASTWIAPRQSVGPTHLALMTKIMAAGRLLLLPRHFKPLRRGQIYLEKCTGAGRNHGGMAMTLFHYKGGTGDRMLFPGDARYTALPSFPAARWTRKYVSVVVPHHGADMHSKAVAASPQRNASRLAYSYGAGNTFAHPRRVTRQLHHTAGWTDPAIGPGPQQPVRETPALRGSSGLGHIWLGWMPRTTLPPACACHCQLQAQQL